MVAFSKTSPLFRQPKVYTFVEYLRREEKAQEKHEFYCGKIVKRSSKSAIQCEIAVNSIATLKAVIRPLPKKFRVYSSDLKIYIESSDIGVYPDALVVCEQPEFWNDRLDVIVNPLLIVEVLSPSTQSFDRKGKFDFYKSLPSFQEYVLINADKPSVETRFREEPDLWRIKTEDNIDNSVALRSLGVSISLADIYEDIVFPEKKINKKSK
jgi:Uma2 family endonuclease